MTVGVSGVLVVFELLKSMNFVLIFAFSWPFNDDENPPLFTHCA